MVNALILHRDDTVAVVTEAVTKGADVTYMSDGGAITVKALEDIPVYHKIAVKSVKKGRNVYKYGEVIGYATADIDIGAHVHTQNLTDLDIKAGESV